MQNRYAVRVAALCILMSARLAVHAAASPNAPYPFSLPWNDTAKTDIDVSSLNAAPAGTNGRIIVKDGHFVESGTGRRIRFLGVVFTGADNFPTRPDAETVARRLAKYGINLVRLHYMDNIHSGNLWDRSVRGHRRISAEQLDRLDYLVSQLKKNGIYVDVNLKVGRLFTADDGLPESLNTIPASLRKKMDFFDRALIGLQKEYAHDLLTHVNPYTGLPYTADPAVLTVELNNENSLLDPLWGDAPDMNLTNLPAPYRDELRGMWNNWLARKYKTTGALATAWKPRENGKTFAWPTTETSGWTFECPGPQDATVAAANGILTVNVVNASSHFWSVQLYRNNIDLRPAQHYVLSFRAKADRPASVYAGVAAPDWHSVGLQTSIPASRDWQACQFEFTATNVLAGKNRIAFGLGNHAGSFSITDVSLREGTGGAKVLKGESLEARNTSIPEYPIGTQSSDWQGFLADTEVAYTNEMRAYLKGSLGLKSLLVDSQIEYGGMAGTYRETGMDYIDNHAYWDHPVIPPGHWSGGTINDTSSLPKLTDLSAVARLSRDRIAGMPYSVSEYNHPAPNEFQAECVPLLASVAAFQDWDTIILHEYGRYGADAKTDAIADYFNVGSNTAKWAFLPTAAVMFRTAAIAPASESQTVRMPATFAEALAAPSASPSASPLDKRLARATGPVADVPTANAGTAKLAVRAPQTENAVFTADSARAKAVAGFVANQSVSLNGIDLVFGDCVNRFGVATVVSLDERPINEAKGVLVTALSRVQNTGEQFAPDRHSVIDWGTGPQLVDAVTADIKLAVDGPRVVYALDDTGARKSTVASTFANGILAFHIGPESASPWFLVARREK